MGHETRNSVMIRPYEAADAAAVSEVIRTTMLASNVTDYPADRLRPLVDYFSPEKVDALNRDRTCLVAEQDGRVIGTAALEGDELVTFFVFPEHQGRGVGSALLLALESAASAEGRIRLVVDASLTGAAFYERHGYRRSGEAFEGAAGPQIPMFKSMEILGER